MRLPVIARKTKDKNVTLPNLRKITKIIARRVRTIIIFLIGNIAVTAAHLSKTWKTFHRPDHFEGFKSVRILSFCS